MAVHVQELIVLPVPALVVDVEKVFSILSFDDQLDSSLAPNVFSVTGVNLVSHFDCLEPALVNPLVVRLHALAPLIVGLRVSLVLFTEDIHFH